MLVRCAPCISGQLKVVDLHWECGQPRRSCIRQLRGRRSGGTFELCGSCLWTATTCPANHGLSRHAPAAVQCAWVLCLSATHTHTHIGADSIVHGGSVSRTAKETDQTVLTITKALTKTTNCTFRVNKVEGHPDTTKNYCFCALTMSLLSWVHEHTQWFRKSDKFGHCSFELRGLILIICSRQSQRKGRAQFNAVLLYFHTHKSS